MHHLQRAAQLNQTGASFLSSNEPEQALSCFEKSLEELLTKSGRHPSSIEGIIIQQPCIHTTGPQHALTAKLDSDDSEGFVYSKPFFFNPEASVSNDHETPSFAAVILFNMALVHHLRACDSAQRTALTFYNQCLSLLQSSRSEFDCSNIIVAALNNKARICDHLRDFHNACSTYHSLADMLGAENVVRTDTIDQDDLQAICLNIYFFKVPTCASSA